jgi:CzcA family heavy metal efflux pump
LSRDFVAENDVLESIIRWSLGNRTVVIAAAVLLMVGGSYIATTMPIDVFPDLTAPTVTMITEGHGMAPQELETLVTLPIESALNGAAHVRRVRSVTAVGISVVWVEFDWDTNVNTARQVVTEKLNLVAAGLPPDVERPILAPITSIMGEILFLGLTSDRHSGVGLRTLADTTIRRRLRSVAGVAQVSVIGGAEKQFQVVLAPSRLQAFQLSLEDVERALREGNENVSAGFLVAGDQEWLVQGIGRVRTPHDIADIVVAVRSGVPIRVGLLGTVRVGEAVKRGEGAVNGMPAVVLGIQKQPATNTLALTRELERHVDEIQATLPEGITIHKDLFRQASFIEIAIRNVEHALRDGAILVVIIVFAFLGNLRAGLISLLAIPLSLLAAVTVLKALGGTINSMTLGGIAIAIGDLVDDAIIDVENVYRRLREWRRTAGTAGSDAQALRVVLGASMEVRTSIVFATFIILLVFSPVFFLSGVEGRLLRPLGFAFCISLVVSLIVAVTLTPVLCSLLLPNSKAVLVGREPALVRWLKRLYAGPLETSLQHPGWVIVPSLVLFAAAARAIPWFGRAFLPEFNEGTLTIQAVTLPGTSLAQSDELTRAVDSVLLERPEVIGVARRTGRAELDEHVRGVESSEIDVTIGLPANRTKHAFLADLRRELASVPGVNTVIGQPISHRIDHMLSGTRANIAVRIFGDDLYKLRLLAEQVHKVMQKVPGVVELSIDQQIEVPILKTRFDRAMMARHGISARNITETLETTFRGRTVSQVLEGPNTVDLVLRLDSDAAAPESIASLPIDTPGGAKVPLRAVAEVVRTTGPNQIARENVQRKIVVQCNVAGRDLRGVVRDIRRFVQERTAIGQGQLRNYYVEYGGQFESAEATTQ